MREHIRSGSILTGGVVLVVAGVLTQAALNLWGPDIFFDESGGDVLAVLFLALAQALQAAVYVGAALIGASVGVKALETAGILRDQPRPPDTY